MPKSTVTDADVDSMASLLRHQEGLAHLRLRRRGDAIIVYSEFNGEAVNHVRFRKLNQETWLLSIANHLERWEPSPFSGSKEDLLAQVAEQFPWILAPIG